MPWSFRLLLDWGKSRWQQKRGSGCNGKMVVRGSRTEVSCCLIVFVVCGQSVNQGGRKVNGHSRFTAEVCERTVEGADKADHRRDSIGVRGKVRRRRGEMEKCFEEGDEDEQ